MDVAHQTQASSSPTASQLRSRLAEIDSQVALLQAEREIVAKHLAAVVYPVLTLPNEIATEIFLRCVEKEEITPLHLASVCRLWRAIALSTAMLWNLCTPNPWRNTAECLHTWLPRAGTMPLDLRLTLHKNSDGMLSSLAQYLVRVRNLTLIFEAEDSVLFPAGLHVPFPALETLSLKMRPPHARLIALDRSDAPSPFRDAPNLHEVLLDGVNLKNWETALPWTQLTRLDLLSCRLRWYLGLLAHTPNLTVLRCITSIAGYPLNLAFTSRRTLPRLHTLDLRENRNNELLGYLTLPALNHLSLTAVTDQCADNLDALLLRSRCAPTTFCMSLRDWEFLSLRECLWSLGSVRHLQLEGPGGVSDDFRRLFEDLATKSDLLPALTSFVIDQCGTNVELRPLVDMLEARRRSAVPLESFRLSFLDGQLPFGVEGVDMRRRHCEIGGDLRRLAGLRCGGLKLDLQSPFAWANKNLDGRMIRAVNTGSFEEDG